MQICIDETVKQMYLRLESKITNSILSVTYICTLSDDGFSFQIYLVQCNTARIVETEKN